jgi:hypothetical protein
MGSETRGLWIAMGRLKDGMSIRQAQAEATTIASQLADAYPKEARVVARLYSRFVS